MAGRPPAPPCLSWMPSAAKIKHVKFKNQCMPGRNLPITGRNGNLGSQPKCDCPQGTAVFRMDTWPRAPQRCPSWRTLTTGEPQLGSAEGQPPAQHKGPTSCTKPQAREAPLQSLRPSRARPNNPDGPLGVGGPPLLLQATAPAHRAQNAPAPATAPPPAPARPFHLWPQFPHLKPGRTP